MTASLADRQVVTDAIGEAFRVHGRHILHTAANYMLRNQADSEDVLSEAFVFALEKARAGELRNEGRIDRWIWKVTRYRAMHARAGSRARTIIVYQHHHVVAREEQTDVILARKLTDVTESMMPLHVLVLRTIADGCTHAEAAEAIGVGASEFKRLRTEALAAFVRRWGDIHGDGPLSLGLAKCALSNQAVSA